MTWFERVDVVRRDIVHKIHSPRSAHGELTHVTHIEQPRFLAHRLVLGGDSGRVLHRHLETGERDDLGAQRDVDIVLMDIMLPTMDGYTTMRAIREISEFKELPIVAVTAKAMKGDREKCLAAGASDYICKPVEAEQLRSILRLWLHR